MNKSGRDSRDPRGNGNARHRHWRAAVYRSRPRVHGRVVLLDLSRSETVGRTDLLSGVAGALDYAGLAHDPGDVRGPFGCAEVLSEMNLF